MVVGQLKMLFCVSFVFKNTREIDWYLLHDHTIRESNYKSGKWQKRRFFWKSIPDKWCHLDATFPSKKNRPYEEKSKIFLVVTRPSVYDVICFHWAFSWTLRIRNPFLNITHQKSCRATRTQVIWRLESAVLGGSVKVSMKAVICMKL